MNETPIFSRNNKLSEVIHSDYRLVSILQRFGIKLGFGNLTVSEVCEKYNVDIAFFLEIINSYHNHRYKPTTNNTEFNTTNIIKYLTNTHNYYINYKIPQIEQLIGQMELDKSEENIRNIGLLKNFFEEYKDEVKEHFRIEEEVVFPYVLALDKAFKEGECNADLASRIRREPIEIYERNHTNIEVKLSDLKNLIIKFLPPVSVKHVCEQLLIDLFRLETDLEDHAMVEEKVLVPRVKKLESKVLELNGVCE